MTEFPPDTWYPVAESRDLPYRHVFHARLLGRDLAVWRADDDTANVWENRCLHRGVRLTLGRNEGAELVCQYHGWRYANRTSACTYIPAHPANAPARQIRNRTYPVVERFGLIWTTLTPDLPFALDWPEGGGALMRPLPVRRGAPAVRTALIAQHGAIPAPERHPAALSLATPGGAAPTLLIQPQDAGRCLLRGIAADPVALTPWLEGLRLDLEARLPAPLDPEDDPLPEAAAPTGQGDRIAVTVARKWQTAEGVTALTLRPDSGELPGAQPGAHVDLTLPDGTTRQYSLTDAPGAWQSWTIAVKREVPSRGGSDYVADRLAMGDALTLSAPRNTFPLRRDGLRTVLIAGGIGLTPLLSMARALKAAARPFELHIFARSAAHVPLPEAVAELGDAVTHHLALDPAQTAARLPDLLGPFAPHGQLYTCGPAGLITAVRASAQAQGWPDDAVHAEAFANDRVIDTSRAFTVELARSARTLEVAPGQTLLEVLRAGGLDLPSGCERGACGTCTCDVIAGTPDHQDAYLSPAEKAVNRRIVPCVSRARTPRLVLDL